MSTAGEAPEREGQQGPDDQDGLSLDITRRKLAIFAVFVVLAVVALYLLIPQLAGLEDTWQRIQQGNPWWLALALVCTLGMFGGYVFQFHHTYRGIKLSWSESYHITMAALAASRLLSAGGAGGLVLQAWALRRAGLEARQVADRTVTFIVTQYLVYTTAVVIFGFGLHFGVLNGNHPFAVTFVPAVLALGATALGLSLGFVPPDLQKRLSEFKAEGGRMRRWIAKAAQAPASASAGIRAALTGIRDRDKAILGALMFWAFQIAVLWASFEAFGSAPPLAVLITGFFVGMLGNLLPLPGGIGGVDAGMVGTFAAFGVGGGLALVAVLVYRGFTFWLPTLPGVIAFISLRRTVDRWEEEGRPAVAA